MDAEAANVLRHAILRASENMALNVLSASENMALNVLSASENMALFFCQDVNSASMPFACESSSHI